MDYELIETEIVARLQHPSITDVCDAEIWPESPDAMKDPYDKAKAYVIFESEKYSPNQTVGVTAQQYTLNVQVTVRSRTLRGSTSVYTVSEKVKNRLIGHRLADFGALYLSEQMFVGYDNENGIWEHCVFFSTLSVRVQDEADQLPDNDITDGEEVFYNPQNSTVNVDETIRLPGDSEDCGCG